MIPYSFVAFGHQIPPKNFPARFARRNASFPYGFAAFLVQMPKKNPARFARRNASFSYVLQPFRPQIPRKFPRRASRAGLLHFPMVLLLLTPKYPQNPGALRAPNCFIFL